MTPNASSAPLPAALWVAGPAAAAAVIFLAVFRFCPAWLLPILVAAPLYPAFALAVRRGQDARALAGVLAWSLAVGLCATGASMHRPQEAERAILHARAYAEETVGWLRTGEGMEGQPARFLPRQAAELAVFMALALATGGAAALVLGAALLGYMGFYVGTLWRLSGSAPLALLVAWPPYALVRVAAYSVLGTALARPALARWLDRGAPRPAFSKRLLALGLLGVAADALLKTCLAHAWRRVILSALGGPP